MPPARLGSRSLSSIRFDTGAQVSRTRSSRARDTKKQPGKHLQKTHLQSVDGDIGKRAAAADFLLLVDGDAFGTAATPRPEHEATGAESACMGGRVIYKRRRWQTRRVSNGKTGRAGGALWIAKASSALGFAFSFLAKVVC